MDHGCTRGLRLPRVVEGGVPVDRLSQTGSNGKFFEVPLQPRHRAEDAPASAARHVLVMRLAADERLDREPLGHPLAKTARPTGTGCNTSSEMAS